MIKLFTVFAISLSFLGCSEPPLDLNALEVYNHHTDNCNIPYDDIKWELAHDVLPSQMIHAIEECKTPKYKRGDILTLKANHNCKYKVYYPSVMYPPYKNKEKIEPMYEGEENCNGLIDEWAIRRQSELFKKNR